MKSLSLTLLLSALASPALAQDLVPQTFRINDLKTNGDACPQGSTTINISEDKEAFTVNFSQFYVQKGPGAEPGDKRKFCRAVFDTEQDANWEYAVLAVNVRGFVQLDDKVVATQELQFGTRGIEYTAQKQFWGPTVEDYVHGEQIAFGNGRWSGCKPKAADRVKDFVVKSTASLTGGGKNASGLMTVDSIDGALVQSYELVWRQCGDKKAKFLATCQVTGNNGRTVFVKGMGRDESRANQKAYQHLQERCAKVGPNFGACDQSLAQCSVMKF
ncbi:MAG: DUF4360 domain-containing protein [Proteobacteria bacterium]|nr:MAG: DUF4360 domain-containing protein [Pseudomonadota bacterium]